MTEARRSPDNETRWNSKERMITRVYRLLPMLTEVAQKKKDCFTADQLKKLSKGVADVTAQKPLWDSLQSLLTACSSWTQRWSSSTQPTLSLVRKGIRAIRVHIAALRAQKPTEALGKAADEWLEGYFSNELLDNPIYHIAELLDWRVTFETQRGKALLDSLFVTLEGIMPAAAKMPVGGVSAGGLHEVDDADLLEPQVGVTWAQDVAAFRTFRAGLQSKCNSTPEFKEEMQSWDTLQKWKLYEPKFPLVGRAARLVLGAPATSADTERLFSLAGRVVSKLRTSLAPETAEQLVLMHDWLLRDPRVTSIIGGPKASDGAVKEDKLGDSLVGDMGKVEAEFNAAMAIGDSDSEPEDTAVRVESSSSSSSSGEEEVSAGPARKKRRVTVPKAGAAASKAVKGGKARAGKPAGSAGAGAMDVDDE
jgi:hypothetical protein